MEYPLFEVPQLGGGMLIAIVAIIHIIIAHFAVGSGIFIAVTHTIAVRRNDELLLRYLRDHVRFLLLFSFVAGALTGVGIWFTISLVSPGATSRLIHTFVWGWAAEWCFFAMEIAAGYVYYYGFDRLKPKTHVQVAWIYAIAAWMSLAIINGILTFMLTPGRWADMLLGREAIDAGLGFWLGIFNDTYWPSLILRTISASALASIFVAIIVNARKQYTREERQRIINVGAYFIAPLALMAPVGIWYFIELPGAARAFVQGSSAAMMLFFMFGLVASVLLGFYAYFGLIRAKRYINLETSLLLLGIAFVATGSMEFVREGVRKPFLIYDVYYSNGIPAHGDWPERLKREGTLAYAPFVREPGQTVADVHELPLHEAGRYVYRAQCRMCHEIEGFNALRPLVEGKNRNWLAATTTQLETYGFMPPFLGDEFELRAILEFQAKLAAGEAYEPATVEAMDRLIARAQEPSAGEIVSGGTP